AVGLVGDTVSLAEAGAAARTAVLNALAAVATAAAEGEVLVDEDWPEGRPEISDADVLAVLDRVHVIKMTGYVASAPGFTQQHLVLNPASELLHELLGYAGVHARSAVGVAALPLGAPVEIELFVSVDTEDD
ncbi:MAG: RidA family protein, partial [Micrococcales bacterium]|nr:RidA family protein [Micrococcales bacterium]